MPWRWDKEMIMWKWALLLAAGIALGVVVGQRGLPAAASGPVAEREREDVVEVRVFNQKGELVGPIEMARVEKSDEEWQRQLTPEQFEIARGKGTERPFCGTLLDNKKEGVYACVCCGLPLFSSDSKFNSGTGWPSFFKPVADENVSYEQDNSYGMRRIEILCTRCDAHLGHVFEDGPRPTGRRYCVNSESLTFTPSEEVASLADPAAETVE
jgi:methionine-R-sulfoxide reductase